MAELTTETAPYAASKHLREATSAIHQRLDDRLDVISALSDRKRRDVLLDRFAALHAAAGDALLPELDAVEGLDYRARHAARERAGRRVPVDAPAFPLPANRCEALGLCYVVEGSTLGGKVILRELAARGVCGEDLSAFDPYGAETGRRWRDFLSVLEREVAGSPFRLREAMRGALRGFLHAEAVLCGDPS